ITSHDNYNISTATVDSYLLTSGSLPLQLLNFTASFSLQQTVNLQWVTASEKGVKNSVIEKSSDNNQYKDLATVIAENSGEYAVTYNYEDKFPVQGINYYRLRIEGLDGSVTYSAVAFAK